MAEKVPRFVKYNAFRWLRDGGFEPIAFALSNVTAQTTPSVRNGLIEFTRLEHSYPASDEIGRLEFAPKPPDPRDSIIRPPVLAPRFQTRVYGGMVACLVAGLALVVLSRRTAT